MEQKEKELQEEMQRAIDKQNAAEAKNNDIIKTTRDKHQQEGSQEGEAAEEKP